MNLDQEIADIVANLERVASFIVSQPQKMEESLAHVQHLKKALNLLECVSTERRATADDEFMFQSPQGTIVSEKERISTGTISVPYGDKSTTNTKTLNVGGIQVTVPVVDSLEKITPSFYYYTNDSVLPRHMLETLGCVPKVETPINESTGTWRRSGNEPSPTPTSFNQRWRTSAAAATASTASGHPSGLYMRLFNGQLLRVSLGTVVNTLDEKSRYKTIPCNKDTVHNCNSKRHANNQCPYVHEGQQFAIPGNISRTRNVTIGNAKTLSEDGKHSSEEDIRRLMGSGSATLLTGALCAVARGRSKFVISEPHYRSSEDL